ncbi:MAG: hypothetical protein NW237_15610 [Cyanobacteriota bacterium]|nr:hypothetical protein [Cyanobacteriota bacterium]
MNHRFRHLQDVPWLAIWQSLRHNTHTLLIRLSGYTQSSPLAAPLFIIVTALALLLWHWRLGLSILSGSLVMMGIHFWQVGEGQQQWRRLKQFIGNGRTPVVGAVAGGAVATLGTYTMASMWAEAEQRWLTTGAMVQGIATLMVLGLLLWEWAQRRQQQTASLFERYLADIASPDAFKRLLGVRRLQSLIQQADRDPDQTRLAVDYLRLALDQESVAVVREAMLEALQGWGILRRLDAQGQPTEVTRKEQVS